MTEDNNLFGKFELKGIPLAQRGVPQSKCLFCMRPYLHYSMKKLQLDSLNTLVIRRRKKKERRVSYSLE